MKTNQPQITLMGRLSLLDSTTETKYNRGKEIFALFLDKKSKSAAERMAFVSSPSSQTRYQIYGSEYTETFPPFARVTSNTKEQRMKAEQLYMLWRLYISVKYMIKLSTKFNSFLK